MNIQEETLQVLKLILEKLEIVEANNNIGCLSIINFVLLIYIAFFR